MSRAGVSLPGSRHVCKMQRKSTPRLHDLLTDAYLTLFKSILTVLYYRILVENIFLIVSSHVCLWGCI